MRWSFKLPKLCIISNCNIEGYVQAMPALFSKLEKGEKDVKISIEELGEIVIGAVIVISFIFLLNKLILPALQQPDLIRKIFEALIGSGNNGG